ncbi:unnamed protein product [Acanthosepion pharaonis]|uniref:Uncharacterized protein n=1 Tax=Acanthosepion pharaonis TaxID=158019 RepID=A0A812BGL2_ACAPH|nr:unnamed protein product [Sepia pharaonis]
MVFQGFSRFRFHSINACSAVGSTRTRALGFRADRGALLLVATSVRRAHCFVRSSASAPRRDGPALVRRSSSINFRGRSIRQVSCYTLLSGFRLPWPPSAIRVAAAAAAVAAVAAVVAPPLHSSRSPAPLLPRHHMVRTLRRDAHNPHDRHRTHFPSGPSSRPVPGVQVDARCP